MKHLFFISKLLGSLKNWRTRPRLRSKSIDGSTPWGEIESLYPSARACLRSEFGIALEDHHSTYSLDALSSEFPLPPSQVVFMRIQLHEQWSTLQTISAPQAAEMLREDRELAILDAREQWEQELTTLPGATPIQGYDFSKLKRNAAILVYCHFGIRSMDAAAWLIGCGFQNVSVIRGGIDAWSKEVDPQIPIYDGPPCE